MPKTFTRTPKPRSNSFGKSLNFVKKSKESTKGKPFSSKKPPLDTENRNFYGDRNQKVDNFGDDKKVAFDRNATKGKVGLYNRKSNNGDKSAVFDRNATKGKVGLYNRKSNNGDKSAVFDRNATKGKVASVENGSRNEDPEEETENKEKRVGKRDRRISIKISAFEKMRMRQLQDPGAGLLNKRKRTKKMSMKIDRYDVSSKRLDDGIVPHDITNKQKKKKDEEVKENPESVELSANAKFRAIIPSPSILSFVQENFLGRRRDIELQRAGYDTELSAPLDNLPFHTTSERARVEESVFKSKLEFFAAAKVSSSFPAPDLPEIAFAGRSNVGKSSLLNALTRQWGVVRTSDKPGLTQTINFFNLGSKLNLVDLPGYGFAYAKDEVKEAWEELVKEYVSTRVGLKRVCLLIDTKWGMKPRDIELIHLMESSKTKYQVVLTKTDVVFPIDVARRAMQIEETLKENKSIVQPVMMVSSKSGAGIRSLRTVLGKLGRYLKP